MKILKFLLLVIITLAAAKTNAQQVKSAYFVQLKNGKGLVLDGKNYYQISPTVFLNGQDTIFKFQHPKGGNPPIEIEGFQVVATITEPLAFKKSECVSWQIVDLYRRVRLTPKKAEEKEVIEVTKTIVQVECELDSIFVDTGSVKLLMPKDTGGIFVNIYPIGEMAKNFGSEEKPVKSLKLGSEVVIWNGENPPKDTSDKSPNIPNLYNLRVIALNEIGLEPAQKGYFVSDDSCFICAETEKLYRPVGEVAVGAQYSPRRPLDDEGLQVSVLLEIRYRYLGKVSSLPTTNGWNRLSLELGARVDYGPFALKVMPKWTPGLGTGANISLAYNLFKWAPKKEARVPKLPHFGLGGS